MSYISSLRLEGLDVRSRIREIRVRLNMSREVIDIKCYTDLARDLDATLGRVERYSIIYSVEKGLGGILDKIEGSESLYDVEYGIIKLLEDIRVAKEYMVPQLGVVIRDSRET